MERKTGRFRRDEQIKENVARVMYVPPSWDEQSDG